MNDDATAAPTHELPRMNLLVFGADALRAMALLEQRIVESELDKPLVELVRLRVSQISGCAFCVDKHAREARTAGVEERRIALLPVWQGASLFSVRERGALLLAEALTRAVDSVVADRAWNRAQALFLPAELVELFLLITVTHTWNRFAIGSRRLSAQARQPRPPR